MGKSRTIVISAASVAAAIQAIGGIAAEGGAVSATRTTAYEGQVRSAMNTAQTQAMVRGSLPVIANTVKIDSKLMRDKYIELAESEPGQVSTIAEYLGSRPFDVAVVKSLLGSLVDSTDSIARLDSRTLSYCYSNCHSACHGSRGWR